MKTPTSPDGLTQFDHLPPEEAVVRAWLEVGPRPVWHEAQREKVRRRMPLLARALYRLSEHLEARPPADESACDHGGELIRKFDGGRSAVLCERCMTILGYLPDDQAEDAPGSPTRVARHLRNIANSAEGITAGQAGVLYAGAALLLSSTRVVRQQAARAIYLSDRVPTETTPGLSAQMWDEGRVEDVEDYYRRADAVMALSAQQPTAADVWSQAAEFVRTFFEEGGMENPESHGPGEACPECDLLRSVADAMEVQAERLREGEQIHDVHEEEWK